MGVPPPREHLPQAVIPLAKGSCKAKHVFRDEGSRIFSERCRKYLGTKAQVAAGPEACVGSAVISLVSSVGEA